MSFVVWGVGAAVVGAAVSVGSKAYKGYRAATADYSDLEAGAEAVQQDQLDLLSGKKALAGDVAQSEFTAGQRNIGMGANMALRKTQAFGEQSYSKSNLATSGTIDQQVETQTKDITAQLKSDMTKIFETRDLSRTQADLSYRKGKMSAEDAYQSTLTGLESQPTGFWEGAFS